MPRAGLLCRYPRCPLLASQCTKHQPWDRKLKRYGRAPANRTSRTAGLRGRSGWERQKRTRAFLRGKECAAWGGPHGGPLELDHIVELADGGADDRSNWQPLCRLHHRAKTAAVARMRRGVRR